MTAPFVDRAKVNAWSVRYPGFAEDLQDVLAFINSKPDIALFKLRRIVENVVRQAYVHFTTQDLPDDRSLSNLIKNPAFEAEVPLPVRHAMHSIRMTGNRAVHGESVTSTDAAREIESLAYVLEWASPWFAESSASLLANNACATSQERHNASAGARAVYVRRQSTLMRPMLLVSAAMLAVAALVWLYITNLDQLMNGVAPGDYDVSAQSNDLVTEMRRVRVIEGAEAELAKPLRLARAETVAVSLSPTKSPSGDAWSAKLEDAESRNIVAASSRRTGSCAFLALCRASTSWSSRRATRAGSMKR